MLIHNGVRLDVDSYGQSECCKAHGKVFSTCDTCEYGEWEEEEDNYSAVNFYMGTIHREWHDDVSKKWNTGGAKRNIIVVAENKEVAKEKFNSSVWQINKTVGDWERYVLEENSICKAIGLLGDFQIIVGE